MRMLELVCMTFAAAASIVALVGFFVLIPHRLEAVEAEQKERKATELADHELLLRMDERLKSIQQYLEKRTIQ